MKIFWYTHFGKPASKNNFSIISPAMGTFEACLYTTVFPAKIFGIAALNT
jgi:hypothetical protein